MRGGGGEPKPLYPSTPLPPLMNLLHDNETPSTTEAGNAVFVYLFPLLSILIFFLFAVTVANTGDTLV